MRWSLCWLDLGVRGLTRRLGHRTVTVGPISAFQRSSTRHQLDLGVPGFDKVFGPSWCCGWLDFGIPGVVAVLELLLAQFQCFSVR